MTRYWLKSTIKMTVNVILTNAEMNHCESYLTVDKYMMNVNTVVLNDFMNLLYLSNEF